MLANVPLLMGTVSSDETPAPPAPLDQAVFDAIHRRDPTALSAALLAGGSPVAVSRRRVETDHDSWIDEACPLADAVRINGPQALALVDVLLTAGAPVVHPLLDHNALVQAAGQHRWELVHRLLDETPSPPDEMIELQSSVHRKVLGAALWDAQAAVLDRLVVAGWRWRVDPDRPGWLDAFLECRQRHGGPLPLPEGWFATLAWCLRHDPNAINPTPHENLFNTPLSRAIQSGQPDLVRALLDQGANLHQPVVQDVWADDETPPRQVWRDAGITPLHLAAQENLPAICRLLLERGADPQRRTDTAWTVAEASGAWHFGQSLDHPDSPSMTPVELAHRRGSFDAAVVLEQAVLSAVVHEEAPDSPSVTPLESGARRRL